MDKENKIHEAEQNKPEISKYREEPFPPKLRWWQWVLIVISFILMFGGLGFIGDQLCFQKMRGSIYCTYIAFGLVLTGLITYRLVRHKLIVHEARREDHSEVDSLLAEARTVIESQSIKSKGTDENGEKKEQLKKEKERIEKLGEKGWTEYQILQFNQMLVDFLKEDELKARARLTLTELEEYAEDSSYRYDWEQYYRWECTIKEAIDDIDNADEKTVNKNNKVQSNATGKLRAELKTLLEHVADYKANWAEGSAMIRDIIMSGVMAIPILLTMGLLPILHRDGGGILYIYNWGLLGITGAITAVLLNLRKSNLVEVGNTEGKRELWRTILSTALGLVAGVLLYSMIAGGILSGAFFPNLIFFEQQQSKNLALSIFWAIASGYSFEWLFDHLRGTIERGS